MATKGQNGSRKMNICFQGALIFYGLPADIRNEPYIFNFKRKIDNLSFAQ